MTQSGSLFDVMAMVEQAEAHARRDSAKAKMICLQIIDTLEPYDRNDPLVRELYIRANLLMTDLK